MRYIKLKSRKKHGNCSWRRTGYSDVVGGKSDRDVIVEMRDYDTLAERRLYKMWIKDKVDCDLIFKPTVQELRMRRWRV